MRAVALPGGGEGKLANFVQRSCVLPLQAAEYLQVRAIVPDSKETGLGGTTPGASAQEVG